MKRLLLSTSLFLALNYGYGQDLKSQEKISVNQLEANNWTFPTIENFDGTFQFIVQTKKNFLLTTETLELIETSRKENEDTFLTLSPFLDVIILSKEKINSADFVGFQSSYIIK